VTDVKRELFASTERLKEQQQTAASAKDAAESENRKLQQRIEELEREVLSFPIHCTAPSVKNLSPLFLLFCRLSVSVRSAPSYLPTPEIARPSC
jgi:hypothetical protein